MKSQFLLGLLDQNEYFPHPSCLSIYRNNELLKLNEFIYESTAL